MRDPPSEVGPYFETPPPDPGAGDAFCLAIFGMLIAAAILGLIIGLALRQGMHLAVRQWSEASPEAAIWGAVLAGLAAGTAALAYFLFVNREVGEMVGRFTLEGCCGLVVLTAIVGIIGRVIRVW